jgi:hypothetical protein
MGMTFGARLLKSIGATIGSAVLFLVVTTVYYGIMSLTLGTFSMEVVPEIFRNSLLLTVTVFGALLYFPVQVVLLMIGKFTRFFLLVLPLLIAIATVVITLYYLKLAPPESRPIDDSFLYEYLRLGVVGFVFVMLNNLLFVKAR